MGILSVLLLIDRRIMSPPVSRPDFQDTARLISCREDGRCVTRTGLDVPGDGMGIRVIVEVVGEDEVRDTPLKSHIISTVLAQLIEAVDIIGWESTV